MDVYAHIIYLCGVGLVYGLHPPLTLTLTLGGPPVQHRAGRGTSSSGVLLHPNPHPNPNLNPNPSPNPNLVKAIVDGVYYRVDVETKVLQLGVRGGVEVHTPVPHHIGI